MYIAFPAGSGSLRTCSRSPRENTAWFHQPTLDQGVVVMARAHVDIDDVFVSVVVHLSVSSRREGAQTRWMRCENDMVRTHVFRERRVAAAEHEDARRLVRKGRAQEVRDVLIILEPVKGRLRLPSYAQNVYEARKSSSKDSLCISLVPDIQYRIDSR